MTGVRPDAGVMLLMGLQLAVIAELPTADLAPVQYHRVTALAPRHHRLCT